MTIDARFEKLLIPIAIPISGKISSFRFQAKVESFRTLGKLEKSYKMGQPLQVL